jgi:DNA-3-methyladenine glycosylase I
MTYCEYIDTLPQGVKRDLHRNYHDNHYGFPLHDDNELFGRLLLEINQAGLNWEIILKKEPAFRKAFSGYDIHMVAAYKEKDRERLLNDAGIIRNRLKIDAAIENAKVILELQKEVGSFNKWLEHHHPLTLAEWVKLFKKTFRFTGGEIVNEFMMSIGYLPGTHNESCPAYKRILKLKPMWMYEKGTMLGV